MLDAVVSRLRDLARPPVAAAAAGETSEPVWRALGFGYPDLALGLLLAGLAFVGSLRVSGAVHPMVYQYTSELPGGGRLSTFNVWFDADFPKIMTMVTDRNADYAGFTAKHPLQRPIVHGAVFVFKRVGLDPVAGLRGFAAIGAALWSAVVFLLLRLITPHRSDAVVMTLLALASASAMFWLVGPESFTLGSLSIMVALCAAAVADRRVLSAATYVGVSAFSLSITVTNWMAGLVLTFLSQPWRRALQHSANAFVIVTLLWSVQKVLIPSAQFFLSVGHYDGRFILDPQSGGPLHTLVSFFSHTMVMPAIEVITKTDPLWYGMTTQMSAPGSASIWGALAVVIWIALLGGGVYALLTVPRLALFRRVLVTLLILQVVLHLLYGHEAFLYSLHFLPLLIALAALGTLTRFRRLVLLLAGALLISCAINNARQLRVAVDTVDRVASLAAPGR